MKIVAYAITDLDHKSTQVKQWCITLWTAAWGLLAIDAISKWLTGPMFYALVLVIPVVFLVLDVQVKRNQRKFLWRAKELHNWINAKSEDEETKTTVTNAHALRFYDPVGVNTVKYQNQPSYTKEYKKSISVRESFLESNTLMAFYLGQIALTMLGIIALYYLRSSTP